MNYDQKRVLCLLKEIDEICRTNSIRYYLAAGTMIGAMRHGGFIPWDDDADVYITRKEWARFEHIVEEMKPRDRQTLSPEKNPESCYTICRYIDTSTTQLYRYHLASPQPSGIMIDFLILDDCPDDCDERSGFIKSLTEYSNILTTATSFSLKCPDNTYSLAKRLKGKISGRDKLLEKFRKTLFSPATDSWNHYVQCDAGVPHVWGKDVFGEPRYVKFEDTYLPVASDVYAALKGAFDEDWMYVPDLPDQEEHIVVKDYCIGDDLIIEDARLFFDQNDIKKTYRKRNDRVIQSAELNKKSKEDMLTYSKSYVVSKYLDHDSDYWDQMFADGEYDSIGEYLETYTSHQCNKSFVGSPSYNGWFKAHYPSYISVEDSLLALALKYLFQIKKLAPIRKILLARENEAISLDDDLCEIKRLHDAINEILSAYFMDDHNRVIHLLKIWIARYPKNPSLLEVSVLELCREQGLDAFDEVCAALRILPNSAVLKMCYAECSLLKGDEIEAQKTYLALVNETDNGLVLKRIRDSVLEKPIRVRIDDEILEIARMRLGGKRSK